MKLSRRELLVTSSVALGSFSHAFGQTPAPAAPPPPQTSFDPLRGNVGIFTGRGGTIGMLVAPDGLVVIDTQFADTAKIALGNLKQMSPRPIDILINTHHHGDHTSGNIVFRLRPRSTSRIATCPRCRRHKPQRPNQMRRGVCHHVRHDWSAKVGSETVSMKYYGPATQAR